MSAKVMGAVMDVGPGKLRLRMALVAIADNADDYGFAVLSMETIASKSVCDVRTAIRTIQALEQEGWLQVRRRVLGGKANVYFVNVEKLGVVQNERSQRSKLWPEFERLLAKQKSGDKMSPKSGVDKSPAAEKSGDNSQGVQVTKQPDSGDKTALPILKNHGTISNPSNTPQPPLQGGADLRTADAIARNAGTTWEQGLVESTAKVMRQCNLTEPRLEPVIRRALAAWCAKTGADQASGVKLMIENQREFVRLGEYMRHSLGWRKFFAQGHWIDWQTWPLDQARLQQRSGARVGM
jgi:Helix-turn-helix domain